MEKEEKLDEIIKLKIETWDELKSPLKSIVLGPDKKKEALEKVEKLYRISTYLLEGSPNSNKLYTNYGALETKIKTGIKYAIKTGIYAILLKYTPRDEEFNQSPKFQIDLLNLYSSGRNSHRTVLNITFNTGYEKVLGIGTYIERYYPGDWEEILEKRYKEALEERAKKSSGR
jgi:hypothetical protein